MRITTATLILAVLCSVALGQNPTSKSDQKLIEQIIENWNRGWQTVDAKLAAQDYSDNADWTNAFGIRKKGRYEIERFLTQVFSQSFVMAGESKNVEQSVRFIKPDIAVVTTRVERAGQQTSSGEVLGSRQTSHLRVFVKSGGSWKIVSHLISDARDPERRDN